jgi:hypothetical protein
MTVAWHAQRAQDRSLPALRGTVLPRLPAPDPGRPPLNFHVDAAGALHAWTALRLDLASNGPGLYRFLEFRDGAYVRPPLPEVTLHRPLLRVLPDGGWLVVDMRARPDELNASHFRADGSAAGSFHIDDSLADLQIHDDRVWVSFSDRAIFEGQQSLFHRGLAVYGLDGVPLATLGELSKSWRDFRMVAPYALNVAGDEVWIYYYTRARREDRFYLLKITMDEPVRSWLVPVHGARAFALGDGCVLFAGSYQYRNLLTLFNCETGEAREVRATYEADGRIYPIAAFDRAVGRGRVIYLFGGAGPYRIELAGAAWDGVFNP